MKTSSSRNRRTKDWSHFSGDQSLILFYLYLNALLFSLVFWLWSVPLHVVLSVWVLVVVLFTRQPSIWINLVIWLYLDIYSCDTWYISCMVFLILVYLCWMVVKLIWLWPLSLKRLGAGCLINNVTQFYLLHGYTTKKTVEDT